jgi:UDP-glucose 4-epimerase
MGISKAMMEKVAIAKSRESDFTDICITRYGNVMGSRGSVIPLFLDQIINNQILTITDPNMTRFMMTLDDAVNLVLYAFQHGKSGEIFVQKSPASSLLILTNAIKELKGLPEYNSKIIGTRHGEKLYEVLLSREEMAAAEDLGEYFRVPPDLRDLNYSKFIEQGELKISQFLDYNSHNTKQLNLSEMKLLLTKSTLLKSAFRDSPSQPVA